MFLFSQKIILFFYSRRRIKVLFIDKHKITLGLLFLRISRCLPSEGSKGRLLM